LVDVGAEVVAAETAIVPVEPKTDPPIQNVGFGRKPRLRPQEIAAAILPARAKHERLLAKAQAREEREEYGRKVDKAREERHARWSEKTAQSPFTVDQAALSARATSLRTEREYVERQRQMAERMKNRDEVQQFLDLASAPDRIAQLRREKVQLIALQKKLLVERELERKRARVAQWDLARKRT
jgi:hypothetical protein